MRRVGFRLRLRFQTGFGRPEGGQALLRIPQPRRGGPARVVGPVRRVLRLVLGFRLLQVLLDLGRELCFPFLEVAITHGPVLRGMGLHLGPVHRHVLQAHQPDGRRQLHRLPQQVAQRRQVSAAKRGQGPEVGLLVPRQNPEPDVLPTRAFELPGGPDPPGVPVDQNLDHHPRVIRGLAFGPIGGVDRTQIQLVYDLMPGVDGVGRREPVGQRRRQQEGLVQGLPVTEAACRLHRHGFAMTPAKPFAC